MIDKSTLYEFVVVFGRVADALDDIDESLKVNNELIEKILNDTKWYRR